MFLKEPELNFAQISNNGNLSQDGQYQSNSWINSEVHAYPISRGGNYQSFIGGRGNDAQNFNDQLTQGNDVEMRSDHVDIAGLRNDESRFVPYQDNNLDLDNNTRQSISEHITDFMKYEIKYGRGLERQIQNTADHNTETCGNAEPYLDPDILTNLSQSCYDCQTDEALFNYEETDRSCSSTDITPQDEDERMFEASDSDESYIHDSEEHPLPRGIHNPNYPGFQHLAYTLQDYPLESPNSYENSLFSNVNIISQNQAELERLSNLKQYDIYDDSNNNTEDTNVTGDKCDGIYETNYVFEQKSEPLENIANLRRSEVISIPTKHSPHGRQHLSFEDDGGELLNGDNSSISQVSTDIFAYSDSADSRDITLNQEPFIPSHTNEEDFNLPQENSVSDFEDDIIALQRDIYEEIQKPLANTIENISEVVNNVIKCIVDHQHAIEDDAFKQFTSELASNQYLNSQERLRFKIFGFEDKPAQEFSDIGENLDSKLEQLSEEISLKMDDAYMTNVKEDLFGSQSSESYAESGQSCDEDVGTSFELYQSSVPKEDVYSTDANCNVAQTETTEKINGIQEEALANSNDFAECNNKQANVKRTSPLPESIKIHSFPKKDVGVTSKISGKERRNNGTKGGFDVYNIETAMPLIDLDAIENHLRAAREEERRRRNDREEIRRRLAMGAELDEFYHFGDRPGRKPSLQARLQSGMNLQICFMNETASDTESPSENDFGNDGGHSSSDECTDTISNKCKELSDMSLDVNGCSSKPDVSNNKKLNKGLTRPSSLALNDTARPSLSSSLSTQAAFFECQARLQTEARMALAQAKEMARMQMEIERQKQESSPITEMLRSSLLKAGVTLTGDRRRVSRQMLTDMNVAQLQVIVNELHTQIEYLNESLVKMLIARDELHMGQDSMLVDIEDLTRHLSAKEMSLKGSDVNDESPSAVTRGKQNLKSHLSTLTSLLTK